MDELIKFIATYFIALSVLGTAVAFVRLPPKRRLQFAVVLVAAGVLSYLFAKIGSHLYDNPRPFVQGHFTPLLSHAPDNGFPSDHTLFAAVLAWVGLIYSRKIGVGLLAITLLIAVSRMAAGVHHLSDVLGSVIFAAAGTAIVYALVRWYSTRKTPASSLGA